jgi:competence protein ComGC
VRCWIIVEFVFVVLETVVFVIIVLFVSVLLLMIPETKKQSLGIGSMYNLLVLKVSSTEASAESKNFVCVFALKR